MLLNLFAAKQRRVTVPGRPTLVTYNALLYAFAEASEWSLALQAPGGKCRFRRFCT